MAIPIKVIAGVILPSTASMLLPPFDKAVEARRSFSRAVMS
jgi:hypothetical protein